MATALLPGFCIKAGNRLINTQIYVYSICMRRKAGQLIPIERALIAAAVQLRGQGVEQFHGFRIAREIKDREGARLLTAHGTLYRALARLEQQGFLQSTWEDPMIAAEESRPRRKLYKLTGAPTVVLEDVSVPANESRLAWEASP